MNSIFVCVRRNAYRKTLLQSSCCINCFGRLAKKYCKPKKMSIRDLDLWLQKNAVAACHNDMTKELLKTPFLSHEKYWFSEEPKYWNLCAFYVISLFNLSHIWAKILKYLILSLNLFFEKYFCVCMLLQKTNNVVYRNKRQARTYKNKRRLSRFSSHSWSGKVDHNYGKIHL